MYMKRQGPDQGESVHFNQSCCFFLIVIPLSGKITRGIVKEDYLVVIQNDFLQFSIKMYVEGTQKCMLRVLKNVC